MNIGILSFRHSNYYPNKRLIEAGTGRGHRVILLNPKKCYSEIEKGTLRLFGGSGRVDVLIPRVGAGIDEYTLSLVRHFELQGIRVIGSFNAIVLARNNFLTLQTLASYGINTPITFYINNRRSFKRALKALGGYPVVLKTINSRQGRGVVRADSASSADFMVSSIEGRGVGIIAQEYFEPSTRRDIRIFVVGQKCIGALELWPKGGEFRSNYHLNARVKPLALDDELEFMAQQAAKLLGLEICGIDILIDEKGSAMVLEVNYSPGFHGLEKATGLDIAAEIIKYLEQTYEGVG